MNYTEIIRGADRNLVVNVIRRSLRCIDDRLVDHGERVAFIAGKIADRCGLDIDRQKLLVLCVLHDIGAYKTEEIDNMVRFETSDVSRHAVYGYVFLHNTTPLGRYAEAILYHHTRYDKLAPLDTPYKTAAALIFLADRIDILIQTHPDSDWTALCRNSGSVFSPELTEAFFEAEEAENLSGRIMDGSYRLDIDAQFDALVVPENEIGEYLKMLVYSIDFRSPFTVTHTSNTTAISSKLAELFGMSERERRVVAMGAFLHDVGKIVIPDSILENPGKLNDEQMRLMRTHVTASGEILVGLVPEEVYKIAVRHHERLDGSGYPLGLSAPELTLGQRIVAVADILSALIGRRSYKEPFPKERNLEILKQMRDSGKQCPRVCDMTIEHYDEIISFAGLEDDPVVLLFEKISRECQRLAAADAAVRGYMEQTPTT